MQKLTSLLLTALFIVALGIPVTAQDATEIMKKSHLAYYYAGDDGLATVNMTIIDKKGRERSREFVMLRLDESDGGNQKYYTYFLKPSDVSRISFMVHKKVDGNDARWIYIPSVDLVKQISADDKNSSFVGSDFSYEDVSGRPWTEDNHTIKSESELDGKAVWVIESIPKKKDKGFARKVSYIDKETFLPLKEEYYNKKDKFIKEMRSVEIKEIEGFLTITHRTMKDIKKNRITHVRFESIDYNVGMTDELFTERYLTNPPAQYIK